MKILQVTTISGTINAFLVPHIINLVEKGNKVFIACKTTKPIAKELLELGIKHNEISFSRNPFSFKNLKAYKEIRELIIKDRYDVIHVHTPVAAFITRLAIRKEKNIRVIYTAHGFHFYKGAPLINWIIYYPLEVLAAKWTDVIITMNNEDYNLAIKKLKRKNNKIYKINGIGIDLSKYKLSDSVDLRFKQELNLQEEDFVIAVIGEMIKRKNHEQILKTMNQLKNINKNIKLLIAGKGPLEENIKNYIKENSLEGTVYLLGYRNDIDKILNISDVVGLFSYQEGLPRNLMEAMSSGKPIICTDIRGNNDLVKNNRNGKLVTINNIEETKNSILSLYENRNVLKKIAVNNINDVKKYDVEMVLNEMSTIYEYN